LSIVVKVDPLSASKYKKQQMEQHRNVLDLEQSYETRVAWILQNNKQPNKKLIDSRLDTEFAKTKMQISYQNVSRKNKFAMIILHDINKQYCYEFLLQNKNFTSNFNRWFVFI
jgi:YesN/AraC family two-component response regulator